MTAHTWRFVKCRDSQTEAGRRKTSQRRILWNAAQRMIFTLQIDPSDRFYAHNEIYDYFCQDQYSLRYSYSRSSRCESFSQKTSGGRLSELSTIISGLSSTCMVAERALQPSCFLADMAWRISAFGWGTQRWNEHGEATRTRNDFIFLDVKTSAPKRNIT